MACQMGLRRLFADKRRCAVSDRMTLGAVLVTVFTLLVFYLVLRRLHNAKRKKKGLRLRRILNYFCNFAELYIY